MSLIPILTASIAEVRAQKARAEVIPMTQTPSDLSSIQQQYDAQSPPVRVGRTIVEYVYCCPDNQPEQRFHFTLTFRGGELDRVMLDKMTLHLPDWEVEAQLGVLAKDRIADWFKGRYLDSKWIQDEVWEQINADEIRE